MTNYRALTQALGYQFNDPALLEQALMHRSLGAKNNERMEFLGDSVLNFLVAAQLYQRYPNASEGQLTRMRAHFICEPMLAEIAKQLKLGDYLILGAGEQRSGGHQRASILADALEAILGAIYLDSQANLDMLQQVLDKLYQDKFNAFDDQKFQNVKDAKTVLQELLQSKKLALPEYEVIKTEGEQHEQVFYVHCKISLLPEPVLGVGNSRRKAEQVAAEQILELLNAKQ